MAAVLMRVTKKVRVGTEWQDLVVYDGHHQRIEMIDLKIDDKGVLWIPGVQNGILPPYHIEFSE